jgi:outer membrane lipase/esterase
MKVFRENLLPRRTVGAVVAMVGLLGANGPAIAQQQATGLTTLQSQTQQAIRTPCLQLVGSQPGTQNPNGTPLQRFFASCTNMVVQSNLVQTTNGDKSQLGDQYETLSPTQANAQQPTQIQSVFSRLLDLRAGVRGFALSQNGVGVSDPRNTAAAGSSTARATGGAAGADSDLGGPWGGFMNIDYNGGTVDETGLQTGYNFHNLGILAGVDYRVSDAFVLGGALGYSYTKSNYDLGMGSVTASTISGVLYGTYYVDRWYLDGAVSYGHVGYDTVRNFTISTPKFPNQTPSATATASPDGNQWSATIAAGYNYPIDSYLITPFVRLGYIQVQNSAFQESEPVDGMGLAVSERTIRSLQSALGLRFSKAVSTSSGVVTPYFTAQWLHEFEDSNPDITAKFVNDPNNNFFFISTEQSTRNYASFALGVSGQFQRGVSAYFQVSTVAWLNNTSVYSAVAGLRIAF